MDRVVTGYMCWTAWDYEIGKNHHGTKVFPSIEAMRDNRSCVDECGVVEVELRPVREVIPPKPAEEWNTIPLSDLDENWTTAGDAAKAALKDIGVSPEYNLAYSIVHKLRELWNVPVVSSHNTEMVCEMIKTMERNRGRGGNAIAIGEGAIAIGGRGGRG